MHTTIKKAKELYSKRDWQQLEELYLKLSQQQKNTELYYLMATANVSQNKYSESIFYIEKGQENKEKEDLFLELKGIISAKNNKVDDAIGYLQESLKINPNLYNAQLLIGQLYYSKGDKNTAKNHFNFAIKIDQDKPDASVSLAKIMLDQGQLEKATIKLRNLEKQFPENASVRMILGQCFLENGAYSFAKKYFEKVIETHPNYHLAKLYIGIVNLHENEIDKAQQIIINYSYLHKESRESIAAMGLLLYTNKNYKKASEYLIAAIEKGPSPISWRLTFVECMSQLGKYNQAINFYKKSLKLVHIKNADYRLSELYELNGEFHKAIESYKKISEEDNKYKQSQFGLVRNYLKLKIYHEAENIAKKILLENKDNIECILLLIESLLLQQKETQTVELIKQSMDLLKLEKYKKTLKIILAMVLNKMGHYNELIKLTKRNKKLKHETIQEHLTEKDLLKIRQFSQEKVDEKLDPVFVVGSQSTLILQFSSWLKINKLNVLNDRLTSTIRKDVINTKSSRTPLEQIDNDKIRTERKRYFNKIKSIDIKLIGQPIIDVIYFNEYQLAIIKKYFPNATVLLLNRNTADIWLSQKIFGYDQVNSVDWNNTVNNIISMDLNLVQIDTDKWLNNDPETIHNISKHLNTELKIKVEEQHHYWKKDILPKDSWKNYKEYLGQ